MIRIREAQIEDSAAIAKVHIDSWRTTYKGIVSDDYLSAMSYQERERKWQELFQAKDNFQFAYVAEVGNNRIVGFASGGINRNEATDYQGELYAIYILHEYQGKGIGRRLTEAIAKRLLLEGRKSMSVWVLESNPACRFYESLGGKRLYEKEINIGDTTLIEVAYGWKDVKNLCKAV
jgi:ribosomal protein S18 acetylase RimI-like enzyme